MKAEEIRNEEVHCTGSPGQMYAPRVRTYFDLLQFIGDMNKEAAAQFAEMNEHLVKIANPLICAVSQEEVDRQLRDRFALEAMVAMMGLAWAKRTPIDLAQEAYRMADAMVEERKKR